MSDRLKELLKEGGECFFFLKVVIFLSKYAHLTHSIAVLLYTYQFCHALAYEITANGVFLCLLGPPLRFL